MEASQELFDIAQFRALVEEVPTTENGWALEYDGIARKDHPEGKMKIHKKLVEGEPNVTIRFEGTFKGMTAENLFFMTKDINIRKKWDPLPKEIKIVEKLSKNSDILYQEVNFPFPMTNREFLQQRFYLNNKDDAELVKKLGLYEKPNKYYVLLVKSIERDDYPPNDKLVRANTKMNYWFIEEDPDDPNTGKLFVLQNQELNGMIPHMLVNKIAGSFPHKLIGAVLDNYKKIWEEEEDQ